MVLYKDGLAMAAKNFPEHLDELQGAFVVDVVKNPIGVLLTAEDAPIAQYPKMLRDIALGRADLVDDVLHAKLVNAQCTKNFQPQRVGHGLKAPGCPFNVGVFRDNFIVR